MAVGLSTVCPFRANKWSRIVEMREVVSAEFAGLPYCRVKPSYRRWVESARWALDNVFVVGLETGEEMGLTL